MILQIFFLQFTGWYTQKQLPRGVLKKRCSENMQQIKLLCNFIEIALRHGCSPVNLLHIFRTPFSKENLWVAASVYANMKSLVNIPRKMLCGVLPKQSETSFHSHLGREEIHSYIVTEQMEHLNRYPLASRDQHNSYLQS